MESDRGTGRLTMPVQTVPIVRILLLGAFFLIVPAWVVTLFTNSDSLGQDLLM